MMSRKKLFTDQILEEYYNKILTAIKQSNDFVYSDDLVELTGLSKGQIGKALQYARRKFDDDELKIKDYVMASPDGYFLPTRGKQIAAYVVHNVLDVNSRVRTIKPIYEWAMEKWPEELKALFEERMNGEDDSDEMEPWAVFNQIINGI